MTSVQWGTIAAGNTDRTAATGDVEEVFSPLGGVQFVERVKLRSLGTNVATVARLFVNNGGPRTDAENNSLLFEHTLPATTADDAAALADQEMILNMWLPPAYRLFLTLGTTVASGYHVTVLAGDYQ